ncbi:hypothetical protein RBWH47_03007 [Rhodopirellula baltica WH47]|uniref:Uncharacterized protein n=1 Tax=Rhodopirellula baltica WH47 TaxID=991778 RepID=F2AUR9_RHOBT|nr:hypothetical protein RBWH47_03007 [Rhodopirellula baltica WH47]
MLGGPVANQRSNFPSNPSAGFTGACHSQDGQTRRALRWVV